MFANNPMNCKNCEYKVINDDKSLHCYMFKNEPSSMCAQFKPKDKELLSLNFEQVLQKTINQWLNTHAKI